VRKADNLHVAIYLKSGSLNFLEPSGPVKACNRIALTFIDWSEQKAQSSSDTCLNFPEAGHVSLPKHIGK